MATQDILQDCLAKETLQELLAADADNLLMIDVRSPDEYAESHVPGTVNIPVDTLPTGLQQVDRAKQIVTVCWKGGGRSATAAEMLRAERFNAQYLCGGTLGRFT